jgi:hypothetical protein
MKKPEKRKKYAMDPHTSDSPMVKLGTRPLKKITKELAQQSDRKMISEKKMKAETCATMPTS